MGALGFEIISLEDAPRERGATHSPSSAVSHGERPASGTTPRASPITQTHVYRSQRVTLHQPKPLFGTASALCRGDRRSREYAPVRFIECPDSVLPCCF